MKESKKDDIKNNKKYYKNENNLYNEDIYNNESKKKNYTNSKNNKSLINKNRIGKFNILNTNTNYKNNNLNNMLTPNKKIAKTSASCNKKINNSKRNYFSEMMNHMKNNYNNSLDKNKQKSLNKKKREIKLTLGDVEQENINNIHTKYNLIFYEKNKVINNLKNELNYYKNILSNTNKLQTNNNTIEVNNKISLMANKNKDNKREKIKNIFSPTNKDKNHIVKYKFNKYNNLQTFMGKINHNMNCNNSEGTKDSIPSFNDYDKNRQKTNLLENYSNNYNIKLLSNNDLSLNKGKNYNSSSNIFNRNNSNLIIKKDDKSKLNIKNNELTFESKYNYQNIDIYNDNKTLKSSKSIFNSFNNLNSSNRSGYKLDNNETSLYNSKDISNKKLFNRILKNQKFCFNNISSPSYLSNHFENKDLIDCNIIGILNNRKYDSSIDFEHFENLEYLKQRMSNLIDNLFSYIDFKNEKAH